MANRLVHLELHTGDLPCARAFYEGLFDWELREVGAGPRPYLEIDFRSGVGGGAVGCGAPTASWLPYVEVAEIGSATESARELGAAVLLEPREGPLGWRSVVRAPQAGELALWMPKRR